MKVGNSSFIRPANAHIRQVTLAFGSDRHAILRASGLVNGKDSGSGQPGPALIGNITVN